MPRHAHRLLAIAAAGVTALALSTTLPTGAVAAAPATTHIKPGTLPRGADVAIPHLEGKTVVDGAVRIRVKGAVVRLLGKSGASYVVTTTNKFGSSAQVLRFAADGTRTVIAKGEVFEATLSSDGQRVLATKYRSKSSTLTVWSVATAQVETSMKFTGYPRVLDAVGDRVLLGNYGQGTLSWDLGSGSVTRLTKRVGGAASLDEDLLSSYTADPYDGGCTVVSRISDPTTQLSRSCQERVESFAPGGRLMVTVHILSDGIGPNVASVRTLAGRLVGRYDIDGWFGQLEFETPKALLLGANGKRQAGTVRCVKDVCELATDLAPVQPPKLLPATELGRP